MERGKSKIDEELMRDLEELADTDKIDALVYPQGEINQDLKRFFSEKNQQGLLNYKILQIGNFIAIHSCKAMIIEISCREDVFRITKNPRFTAQ